MKIYYYIQKRFRQIKICNIFYQDTEETVNISFQTVTTRPPVTTGGIYRHLLIGVFPNRCAGSRIFEYLNTEDLRIGAYL